MNRLLTLVLVLVTSTSQSQAQVGDRSIIGQVAPTSRINPNYSGIPDELTWNGLTKLSMIPGNTGPSFHARRIDDLSLRTAKEGDHGFTYLLYHVESVVDSKNVILNTKSDYPIWLEGYDTTGLTDDMQVQIVDRIKVVGTKNFTTVMGSRRTVRLIRMLPVEEQKAIEKQRFELSKALEKQRFEQSLKYRQWSDVSNKHTIEAAYVSGDSKSVVLRRKDGQEITIERSKISLKDRKYLKELDAKSNLKTKVEP